MTDLTKRLRTNLYTLSSLIGDTPLLAIRFRHRGCDRTIYAKAEFFNMTGSIKDRMAFSILEKAYGRGDLCPSTHLVEVSSGNTGISFAALGAALGHPVTILIPDWVSCERSALLKEFGAELIPFSREDGGFPGAIEKAEQLGRELGDTFLPAQFSNPDNIKAHYESTGPEIYHQLQQLGLEVNAFIAGVGTSGSIMGVGRFLREKYPSIGLHPLEPTNAPIQNDTPPHASRHRIEGLSDGLRPDILDLDFLDSVITVDDGDAILMAQKLASQLGMGVGISSGANFLGALRVLDTLDREAVVVTLFPDDNKKYISTDLFRNEALQEGFLAPEIRLLGMRAIKGRGGAPYGEYRRRLVN
ncbi:cysteine synthase family protein [Methanococcoides sp. SA1]|nr:cysteine synthase family protein [Methanococcoides sp. SA1]